MGNNNFDSVHINITGPDKVYPDPKDPEVAARFKSLDEYLVIAKKVIRTFAPQFISKADVNKMVNSENAVSEIARHLMMADWGYDKTKQKSEYSYRNQCGLWAIQDYLGSFKTKASKENYSLDMPVGNSESPSSLMSILEDKSSIDPSVIVNNLERKERINHYIKFLIKNSKLSDIQINCLQLKYFDGINSYAEIGRLCKPKLSRQAVQQTIDRAIYRLKQTALGTKIDKVSKT